MAQKESPRLLKRLPFHDDESVVSFVQRHCAANYVPRMLDMLRLIERVACEPVPDVRDIVLSRAAIKAVEKLTGLSAGALDACFIERVQETHLREGHHEWQRRVRRSEYQAVCSACLRETGYARRSWEYVQAPVCTVHGFVLIEACPSCLKPLRHRRSRLLACGECERPLVGASQQAASEEARRVAAMVQRPSILPMGDRTATSPIDPQDLSALLRLSLPPGPGRGTLSGLTEVLTAISVAERVSALERLGSAMEGRRIDSAKLRTVALERWMSAALLPPSVQVNLLAMVASTVELTGDLVRLICYGNDERRQLSAAAHFEGRPPSLKTLEEVAAFLGVDLGALHTLRGIDGLDPAAEGLGHDMDQVLAMQRTLEALLSIEQVDAVMGRVGLTHELLHLNLLRALTSEDGTIVGVHLEPLDQLLSGIQQNIDIRKCPPSHVVRLCEGLEDEEDLSRVAWMIAQVRGGSLTAYAWPAPHRVTDLLVDGARQSELADLSLGMRGRNTRAGSLD